MTSIFSEAQALAGRLLRYQLALVLWTRKKAQVLLQDSGYSLRSGWQKR